MIDDLEDEASPSRERKNSKRRTEDLPVDDDSGESNGSKRASGISSSELSDDETETSDIEVSWKEFDFLDYLETGFKNFAEALSKVLKTTNDRVFCLKVTYLLSYRLKKLYDLLDPDQPTFGPEILSKPFIEAEKINTISVVRPAETPDSDQSKKKKTEEKTKKFYFFASGGSEKGNVTFEDHEAFLMSIIAKKETSEKGSYQCDFKGCAFCIKRGAMGRFEGKLNNVQDHLRAVLEMPLICFYCGDAHFYSVNGISNHFLNNHWIKGIDVKDS